jgi:hypothetical protein
LFHAAMHKNITDQSVNIMIQFPSDVNKKIIITVPAQQIALQIRKVLKTGIGFTQYYPLDAWAVFRVLEYRINQEQGHGYDCAGTQPSDFDRHAFGFPDQRFGEITHCTLRRAV